MTQPNTTNLGNGCTDANKNAAAPGSQPVGVGRNAEGTCMAKGAATGAATDAKAGATTGAKSGAMGGDACSKAAARGIDATVESNYWRDNCANRPYFESKVGQADYAPAYQYGWESFGSRGIEGQTFESVEADLGRGWLDAKGSSHLAWDKAKAATRDAWDRVKSAARTETVTTTTK